jgi:disulfide bond formation protein DsbB
MKDPIKVFFCVLARSYFCIAVGALVAMLFWQEQPFRFYLLITAILFTILGVLMTGFLILWRHVKD